MRYLSLTEEMFKKSVFSNFDHHVTGFLIAQITRKTESNLVEPKSTLDGKIDH